MNEQEQSSQNLNDPFGPSYPESAVQYIGYRISIVVIAVIAVMFGKSNLPSDAVKCIQDVVIDALQPITNYYLYYQSFGLFLMTLMQLIVDLELLAMAVWWLWLGNSFRYPLCLCLLGLSKIIINALFQTKVIENSFTKQLFPSLIFGQNFINTYFFSGVVAFLMITYMQLVIIRVHKILWIIQITIIVIVCFLLLSMRQNYFIDIITGIVFGHFVHDEINKCKEIIDRNIVGLHKKIVDRFNEKQNKVSSQKN